MRPLYNRNSDRVRGYIFVAALTFLLEGALERKLRAGGVGLSPWEALEALETIHVMETGVGDQNKVGVNGDSRRARHVLGALGITKLEPPYQAQKERIDRPGDKTQSQAWILNVFLDPHVKHSPAGTRSYASAWP